MPARHTKTSSVKSVKKAASSRKVPPQKTRLWLNYPRKLITDPVIWQIVNKFKLIINIRHPSVSEEIGIVCLEMEGARPRIKAAIKWLEKIGVQVEPVEINVIES